MSDVRVVVAVRDKEHVEDLIRLGCELAKGKGSEILAISVAEIAPALPLDAESDVLEQPAREALECASRVALETCGVKLRTRLVRARDAGPAIVDEARDLGADHLVLGYYGGHGIIGEFLLGSCVRYVATHSPCKVVLAITPPSVSSAS